MKTQIKELKRGSNINCGTNHIDRNILAEKVISENENLLINIRGYKLSLCKNVSLSGKTVTFFGVIPLELYRIFCGTIGLIKKHPEVYMLINNDMTVCFYTNSKKQMYQYINESEITILEN